MRLRTTSRDAIVSIVTLVLLVSSVLVVCTRIGMKLVKSRRIYTDDTLIILALVRSLIPSSYHILNNGYLATRYHTIGLSD